MSMKIGLGLYRSLLTPGILRFARQVGVTHIVAHVPGGFSRGKGKVITSDGNAPASGPVEREHHLSLRGRSRGSK